MKRNREIMNLFSKKKISDYLTKKESYALLDDAADYLDIGLSNIIFDNTRLLGDCKYENEKGITTIGIKEIKDLRFGEQISKIKL